MHKSVEWHTPPEYISAVREVLGEIWLDPASNATANETVQAKQYFDREMNGLAQQWHARTVYLNPPHDRANTAAPWVHKLLSAYQAGDVQEAILLVDAATETGWFSSLYDYPLCFVQGRIRFQSGDGREAHRPITGSVFVYLGQRRETFTRVFGRIGRIYLPLSPSQASP